MIHLLYTKATKKQVHEMLESLESYIKLAVDINRGIAAGGGVMHADCEAALIEEGCLQENIWGADWIPDTQELRYEALINIRPQQNNSAMEILDSSIKTKINNIARNLLGDI